MDIHIVNTLAQYKRLLSLPEGQRKDFYQDTLFKPFAPMFESMQMRPDPEMLSCLPVAQANDEAAKEMLAALEAADAWGQAQKAMELAAQRFQDAHIPLPSDVTVGIFLGDPQKLTSSRGYTGAGSIPGFVEIIIAPNDYNLPRLAACVAHELHHNVLFHNTTWDFMQEVTVARYLAVEGLAESFAQSLYGESALGPWVTDISAEDLAKAKRLLEGRLDVQGFPSVSPYIFGDSLMMSQQERTGMPFCGGYAVGYHAVQSYLKKTGQSVESSTLLDGDAIIKASGYW